MGCAVLIRFRVRNFRSLKEEQELSLVASSLKGPPEAVTLVEGLDLGLVRVAAIYGANASGKSNVIKALAYMSSAVQNSQRQWAPEGPIPREPFLLDPQSKLDPSSFEVDLLLDGTRFHYGFTLNDREILEEWLEAYPTGSKPIRKQMWFKREAKTFTFGKKLVGDNDAIERLTRPNSLFLSAAAQNNHEALLPLYEWFAKLFTYVPKEREGLNIETAKMCRDETLKTSVLGMLRLADLGVVGLDVRETEGELAFPTVEVKADIELRAVAEQYNEAFRRLLTKIREKEKAVGISGEKPVLDFIHTGSAKGGVTLGEHNESDGTLAFFGLLGPALGAVKSGGTIFVDELDASLHPLLALEVVRFFNDPRMNPRGAQIIFTTQDRKSVV